MVESPAFSTLMIQQNLEKNLIANENQTLHTQLAAMKKQLEDAQRKPSGDEDCDKKITIILNDINDTIKSNESKNVFTPDTSIESLEKTVKDILGSFNQ
jgi:hypothetical protein